MSQDLDEATPRPPKLWVMRKFAVEKLRKLAAKRPPRLSEVDWADCWKTMSVALSIIGLVMTVALMIICLPGLNAALSGSVSTLITGSDSIYNPRFKPIAITTENSDLWAAAVSGIPREDSRKSMEQEWRVAVKRAEELKTNIAMVDAETIEDLAKSTPSLGAKRREAMIAAMVAELSAGGSDQRVLSKAREALAQVGRSADPLSRLGTRFGPSQICSGLAYARAMLPYVETPEGACRALSSSSAFSYYLGGLGTLILEIAIIGVLVIVGFHVAEKVASWASAQSDLLMARWEREQMDSASKGAQAAPTRRRRL